MPSCATAATRFACSLVSSASVTTTPIVVFAAGARSAPGAPRRRQRRDPLVAVVVPDPADAVGHHDRRDGRGAGLGAGHPHAARAWLVAAGLGDAGAGARPDRALARAGRSPPGRRRSRPPRPAGGGITGEQVEDHRAGHDRHPRPSRTSARRRAPPGSACTPAAALEAERAAAGEQDGLRPLGDGARPQPVGVEGARGPAAHVHAGAPRRPATSTTVQPVRPASSVQCPTDTPPGSRTGLRAAVCPPGGRPAAPAHSTGR